MKFAAVLTVLALGLCLALVGTKTASSQEAPITTATEPQPDPAPLCDSKRQATFRHSIRYWRTATWKWQDRMFKERSRLKTTDAKYVHSCTVLNAIQIVWVEKAQAAKKAYKKFRKTFAYRVAMADKDFNSALTLASSIFNVSRSWLHACAKSEGGTGAWVSNHQGSGAGGWMQFMSGTFYGYVHSAFTSAASRGYHIPHRYKNWYSAVGQAITAAYMFATGQSGHWVGSGC